MVRGRRGGDGFDHVPRRFLVSPLACGLRVQVAPPRLMPAELSEAEQRDGITRAREAQFFAAEPELKTAYTW